MSQGKAMNKNKVGLLFLSIAAVIAILTALAHMSCIFLGESCYRSQLAPEVIIQSAVNGTLLAPVGTTLIFFAVFSLCYLCIICRKRNHETSLIENCYIFNFYFVYSQRISNNSTFANLPRNG